MTAILDATARVLVTTGYDRASTNRIATAAGVSVGSLYQYFPSKEALVAALIERHVEKMMSVTRTKLAESAGKPLEQAARELVSAIIEAHAVDPKLHKVLLEQVPRVGRLERLGDVEAQTCQLVLATMRERREDLKVKNLAVAAFVLVNAVEGITHAALLHRGDDVPRKEALIDEIVDLIVRYLRG